ncbi:MAG: hypothetical protein K9H49_00600 [Bacteroidales bacterium]|nr:hypothetical protein [Bacteroidales bacterium]MCF8389855.1 hypothetical protein [Bacteroidales bacterium]
MNISVLFVEPEIKGGFLQELNYCIAQIKSKNLAGRIISTTAFLNIADNESFIKHKNIICDSIRREINNISSINYICQPPAKGDQIAFEIHLIDDRNISLKHAEYKGFSYVRAVSDNLARAIFVSGIQYDYSEGVLNASEKVFSAMEEILQNEGLSFNNIVRQWNYIENILNEIKQNNSIKQHYQIFNDIRSKYYGKVDFINGYPAATGIGTLAGGVTVSFYAHHENDDIQEFQIDNPLQQPAFKYPSEVLVGESSVEFCEKTTPKFVRAKHIRSGDTEMTFVSGTASIRHEKTVALNDMQEQTKVTIENIQRLISQENLEQSGIPGAKIEKISYYRAYVKNAANLNEIIQKCEELLPGIPYLFLISDICRSDLLIEIEAFSS